MLLSWFISTIRLNNACKCSGRFFAPPGIYRWIGSRWFQGWWSGFCCHQRWPRSRWVIHSANVRGRAFASPFEKEREAMSMALGWILQSGTSDVTICTDSQALLKAIQCGSPSAASIINQLNRCSSKVVLQWIPAHSGFAGNTLADLEARSAVYNLDELCSNTSDSWPTLVSCQDCSGLRKLWRSTRWKSSTK